MIEQITDYVIALLLGIITWQNNRFRPFLSDTAKFLKENVEVLKQLKEKL